MQESMLRCFLILSFASGVSSAAADAMPVAEFNAEQGIADSGWTLSHDRPRRAAVTVRSGILRIEDDDENDEFEDSYLRFHLTPEQRSEARLSGFVYEWTLRIPQETGQSTRAISTEVCVEGDEPESRLRFGLQFGRRGTELLAMVNRGSDGPLETAAKVDNPGAFHHWALAFDGTTQALNLFLNGQRILKSRIDHCDKGHSLVFGSRSTGEGTSEWKHVRFSLGTGMYTVIAPPRSESPNFWIFANEKSSLPERIDVFEGGRDGYFAYRIPSFIVAPNGDLLVFCEGRKNNLNDDGDIDLLMKRSSDGGGTWQRQQLVYEEGGDAHIKFGNPTVAVEQETGVLWLAANRDYLSESGARAGGGLVLFRSDDSGFHWSNPIDITASIKEPDWGHHAFGPGIGIQVRHGPHQGRLLFPANFRRSFDKRQPSYSHVIFSDDRGKSWKPGGRLGDYTNECQIAETMESGKSGLLINMRNHWGRGGVPQKSGHRLVSRSHDGGHSWETEVMDPELSDPPCQASLYRFSFASRDQPSRLLFANPIGPGRSNLRVRLSLDEGRTWPHGKLVAIGSAAYSCMARLPDNRVGIVYERSNYQRISFSEFPVDWLTD